VSNGTYQRKEGTTWERKEGSKNVKDGEGNSGLGRRRRGRIENDPQLKKEKGGWTWGSGDCPAKVWGCKE